MKAFLIGLGLVALCLGVSQADQRLWVEARINGDPARFIFDTGADRLLLFQRGADRLGLATTKPPVSAPSTSSGAVPVGMTEPCDLQLWRVSLRTSLAVLEIPDYLHMGADGILGWGPLSENIVKIDASALKAVFLEAVPEEASAWTRLQVETNSSFLFLRVPHQDGSVGKILVDTGFAGGVALHPKRWREWVQLNTNQPMTLDSYYMPGAGLVVRREGWARRLDFGPLNLTEIPVEEANRAQVAQGSSGYEGSLGLAALKRLDFIVDGIRGCAYLRLKEGPPPPYEHNRLGAVFVPSVPNSDDLVATVLDPSPAHEAGVRNRDVLLNIGALDVTKWRSDPAVLPLSRFWSQPAGTHIDLTVRRDGQRLPIRIRLRDILLPHPSQRPGGTSTELSKR